MQHIELPEVGGRVEKASHFVPSCNRLLDVGCGEGYLIDFIKDRVKHVYGVDNNVQVLTRVKKKYFSVKYTNLDIGRIPFSDNFFDCATCLDVIEHVTNPIYLLKEISRVMKPKAILIISTPNIRFSDHIYKLVFEGVFPKTSLDPTLYDGGHVHFFTYKDMIKLLQSNSFQIIKVDNIINKIKRGWKGRLIESFIGERLMNEFRSPGILLIARKI